MRRLIILLLCLVLCALPASAALRHSTSASGTGTNAACTAPTGVATNDILIVITSKDSTGSNGTISGYTSLVTNQTNSADGQSTTIQWKRATGTDSFTFASGVSSADWLCQVFAFSGRDTGNPPVAGTVGNNNTGASSPVTIDANGVTAIGCDDLLWLSAPDVTASGAGNGHTPPSGYTEQQDTENGWQNISGATKENVSAGATGTVSGSFAMTSGTAGYTSLLIRIPAASCSAAAVPRRAPMVFQ